MKKLKTVIFVIFAQLWVYVNYKGIFQVRIFTWKFLENWRNTGPRGSLDPSRNFIPVGWLGSRILWFVVCGLAFFCRLGFVVWDLWFVVWDLWFVLWYFSFDVVCGFRMLLRFNHQIKSPLWFFHCQPSFFQTPRSPHDYLFLCTKMFCAKKKFVNFICRLCLIQPKKCRLVGQKNSVVCGLWFVVYGLWFEILWFEKRIPGGPMTTSL